MLYSTNKGFLRKGLTAMKLNPNVNVPSFLKAVQACDGEVYFVTPEGDRLSLKSTLTQFVFTTVISNKLQNMNGSILLQNPEDAVWLQDYCCLDKQDANSYN